MGLLFAYVLKSSFCLVVFYLFYRLLLSKNTFHCFNRITLLSALTLSWLIPLCPVLLSEFELSAPAGPVAEFPAILPATLIEPASEGMEPYRPVWIAALLLFYGGGILFFMGRHLYSFWHMRMLIRSGSKRMIEPGIYLITHERNGVAPFSWLRYVVLSELVFRENGNEVLAHELAHIRKRHSVDVLIADLSILLQWFNPAAWLLKRELVDLHEYEADESVIRQGVDVRNYQLLLIKKAVGLKLYTMANSFNHSNLKKRIAMMLKEKTNPWKRLKYLLVFPLAAVSVTALSRPEVSRSLESVSSARVADLFYLPVEQKDTVAHSVISKSGPDEQVSYSVSQQGNRVNVTGRSLKKEKDDSATSAFSVRGISVFGAKKNTLILVDGKKVANLDSVNADKVASFSVLQDSSAVQIYGNEGKDGVVLVTTKSSVQSDASKAFEINEDTASVQHVSVSTFTSLRRSVVSDSALVFVDGKEVSARKLDDIISSDSIKSFSVLKGETGTKLYGSKAKNGVVMIELKKEAKK